MARKTKTGATLVTFLLDRSSSMASIKKPTIDAFNTYLDTLREQGKGIEFTFLQFDTISLDKLCVAEPIATVKPLDSATFQPRGSTPLIDAAVKTIKAVAASLPARKDKPKIVVCFQTDGEENSSTQHTWEELNALIKEKTAEGWQFNFMGAGIDAYQQGQRMGVSVANTMSYDSSDCASTEQAFTVSAQNTAQFSAGTRGSTGYTMSQKLSAGDKFDPGLGGHSVGGRVSGRIGNQLSGGNTGGLVATPGSLFAGTVSVGTSINQPLDLTAPHQPQQAQQPVPKPTVDDFSL